MCGRIAQSVQRLATGWTVRGSKSRWVARFSAPVQTGIGAHPASCTMGTGSFPGVRSGRGVTMTNHTLLVPWSRKSRAIPLFPPMGRTACTEPQCLYSTAIPLLPLWAVWPVQSLSACTIQLYLYSPYGPNGLYTASVPVQYSYTSTPLSACTVQLYLYSPVPVQSSYTSTPLSACTVQLYLYSPQCLYSTAIPLLPSVHVQYSYKSTPLSACTVQLYLYSPLCLYSTAIPLLPL